MEQYQQKTSRSTVSKPTAAKPDNSLAILENRVYVLNTLLELQARQIRRLESQLEEIRGHLRNR